MPASSYSVVAAALGVGVAGGWAITALVSPFAAVIRGIPFLLVLLLLGGTLVRERRVRGLSLFSPLSVASLAYSVMFALVPLADLWFNHPAIHSPRWASASWAAVLCALLIVSGYIAVASSRPATPAGAEMLPWSRSRARAFAAVGIVLPLAVVFVALGGPTGVLQLIGRFSERYDFVETSSLTLSAVSLAAPAIALQTGSWISRPTVIRALLLLLLWLPPALLVSAFLGQRWRVLTIFVLLAALVHLGYRRIPASVLALLLAILTWLFVTVGLERNFVGRTGEPKSISGANFYYNYVGSGHELGQFRDFVVTLEGVPDQLAFQYGRTFAAVIPGAPFPTGGNIFTRTFFPVSAAEGTSIPTPLPGELYLNFGVPGMVVGTFLFGTVLGSVEVYRRRRPASTGALVVYAYSVLPLALVIRGEFATFAGYYVVGLAFLLLAVRFVERNAEVGLCRDARAGSGLTPVAAQRPTMGAPVPRRPA
jgi:oligosaccharide repeat unit polymerase